MPTKIMLNKKEADEMNERLRHSVLSSESEVVTATIKQQQQQQQHLSAATTNSRLFLFTPSKIFPKLRLFKTRSNTAPLKCIVRRQSLLVINQTIDEWHYVLCNDLEGWCRLDRAAFNEKSGILSKLSSYGRYLEWGGNNRFFCHGKVMVGSDFNFFLGTNVLYIAPSLLFFIFVMPLMDFPVLCGVVLALIFIYSLVALWKCALTEPGIIPRNSADVIPMLPEGENTGIHGYKLCETCNLYRPPRSKHCARYSK